jgi:hypothetical protein
MRLIAPVLAVTQLLLAPLACRSEMLAQTEQSTGPARALRLADNELSFCDARGAERWDLRSGRISPARHSCGTRDEPNTACASLPLQVDVRSPMGGTDDIVDVGNVSVPLTGRVHDCSADGKTLAIVTGSSINAETGNSHPVAKKGGDRIAIGSGWIAWTDGSTLHAVRR